MAEKKTVKVNEKVTTSKSDVFNIITAVILAALVGVIVTISILIEDFYPLGTIICSSILLVYVLAILVFKVTSDHKVVVEKVVEKEVKVVAAPAPAPAPTPKKAEFVPFAKRMKKADKSIRDAYNEIKSEILSYGIKSRVSSTGDTFRLHTKEYVKIVIAGKTLKLYMALNPRDYKNTTIPFDDASKMLAHKETPFVFKIKSDLSLRRAKVLIADCAKKDGLEQGEVIKRNHANDL